MNRLIRVNTEAHLFTFLTVAILLSKMMLFKIKHDGAFCLGHPKFVGKILLYMFPVDYQLSLLQFEVVTNIFLFFYGR